MGQTLSTIIGYFIVYIIRLTEKTKSIFYKDQEKSYFNKDMILKDDEQQADILSSEDINKIILKQQNIKKSSDVNLNEYKMIKNNELDETECLTVKTDGDNNNNIGSSIGSSNINKELLDLHKEMIDVNVGEDSNNNNEENDEENIEDLKASIMNHSEL